MPELHADPHDYLLGADANSLKEQAGIPSTPGYLLQETGDYLLGNDGAGGGSYIWMQSASIQISYGMFADPHDYDMDARSRLPWEIIDLPTLIAGDILLEQPHQFVDSFQTGDVSGWDGEVDADGDLNVITDPDRKEHGSVIELTFDDTNQAYVYKNLAADEADFFMRFWYNRNDLAIENNKYLDICHIQNNGGTVTTAIVRLANSGGVPVIQFFVRNDSAAYTTVASAALPDPADWLTDWQEIRIRCGVASAVGANDGFGYLWVDDVLIGSDTAIDNDTIDGFSKGFVGTLGSNSTTFGGSFYLDEVSFGDTTDEGSFDLLAETGDTLVLDSSVETKLSYKFAADPKFYTLIANQQLPVSPSYDDIEGYWQLEDESGYLVQEDGTSKMIIWMRR